MTWFEALKQPFCTIPFLGICCTLVLPSPVNSVPARLRKPEPRNNHHCNSNTAPNTFIECDVTDPTLQECVKRCIPLSDKFCLLEVNVPLLLFFSPSFPKTTKQPDERTTRMLSSKLQQDTWNFLSNQFRQHISEP